MPYVFSLFHLFLQLLIFNVFFGIFDGLLEYFPFHNGLEPEGTYFIFEAVLQVGLVLFFHDFEGALEFVDVVGEGLVAGFGGGVVFVVGDFGEFGDVVEFEGVGVFVKITHYNYIYSPITSTYQIQKIFKFSYLKIFQMRTSVHETQPIQHVVNPYVVGGAVIALKCKEGIVIGTDTLLSYGSLLKYPDVCRYEKIADNVLIAASGQYADFQEVTRRLKDLSKQSEIFDDGVKFSAKEYANYLASICYEKRNNFNPYYNTTVIAGFEDNECILGSVDLYGNYIKKDYITTGFAKHFGLSLIANDWNPNCTVEEAKNVIRRCFEVIYMRDCHSLDQVQLATVTRDGAKVENPEKVDSKWSFREFRERKNQKLWQ